MLAFVDSGTRETVELETRWTMAEFEQFELKTNMVMEVERKIHIQLAHGGVVIKSRARAFFNADQTPNDVHAALQVPARLVKHDGAIFVTYEGNDIVTRGFAGDVARWTLPSPDRVIEACHASACAPAASGEK